MKLEPGQRALVTGASRGLGVEIALSLASQGLDLVLAARSTGDLNAVAARIGAVTGRKIDTHLVNMADPTSVQALANAAGAVDVLVNNAGVEGACIFDQRDPQEIIDTIQINLTGPLLLSRALLPGMISRARGHIVNVASVAGMIAVPYNEPYSATKAGLIAFTRGLRLSAQDQGWPVSASVVSPGFIDGAGMFETLKQDYGVSPDGLGVTRLDQLGPAVLHAIEQDLPEVVVAADDIRQLAAMSVMDPAGFEEASAHSPATAMFRAVALSRAHPTSSDR